MAWWHRVRRRISHEEKKKEKKKMICGLAEGRNDDGGMAKGGGRDIEMAQRERKDGGMAEVGNGYSCGVEQSVRVCVGGGGIY